MRESTRPDSTAIVLLGGGSVDAATVGALPAGAIVIAADSGAEQAVTLGLDVDVVVGDMDSVDTDLLAMLESKGVRIERLPADKNETDAELALRLAVDHEATAIVVVGGGAGRLDHQLGLFAALFSDALRGVRVEARLGASRAYPLRGGETVAVACTTGSIVGLLPFGGDAHGITTRFLQWPLHAETLVVDATRGVSNRATADRFEVSLEVGRLLITLDAGDEQ
jgi:thiamine pyrophosphokinase